MAIKMEDVRQAERVIIAKFGYSKFKAQARYGYIGIDVFNENGDCLRTHRTGLTKKEAYYCLCDLAE